MVQYRKGVNGVRTYGWHRKSKSQMAALDFSVCYHVWLLGCFDAYHVQRNVIRWEQ
jgi:hypothetical protein